MRKVLFALVVLLIASPAMAATVVEISCNDEGGGWASINYKVTRGAPDPRVRAFALDISASSGVIDGIQAYKTGESTAASPGYGIFPGKIDLSNPQSPGWGDPVAHVDDPGTAGVLGDPAITIELGSLYTPSGDPLNAPLDDDGGNPVKLCEVHVTESCTLTITEEPVRGGVVLEDPAVSPTVNINPPCSVVPPVEVPDVTDMNETEAATAITNAGLVSASVDGCSDIEAVGEILDQDPIGGTMVLPGSTVTIVVSIGQPIVPDLDSMHETEVRDTLYAVGIGCFGSSSPVGTVTQVYDAATVGSIIDQTPAASTTAPSGSKVSVTVSLGLSDCYTAADKAEWEAMGRPSCWCYPRQCHGDADNQWEHIFNHYYVYLLDLNWLKDGWMIMESAYSNPVADPWICADFDHSWEHIFNHYRVYLADLQILKDNWMIQDGPAPDCP